MQNDDRSKLPPRAVFSLLAFSRINSIVVSRALDGVEETTQKPVNCF